MCVCVRWCVCVLLLSTVDELELVGPLEARLHAVVHPQLVRVLKELLEDGEGRGSTQQGHVTMTWVT